MDADNDRDMNTTKLPTSAITDVAGIEVGHFTDTRRPTGCSVIITRETDLLHPSSLVDRIHAVLLSGGSAWGLDAASGVMQWLEEHSIGLPVGFGLVPIVPAAVLFDLPVGDAKIRPDAQAGYQACVAACRSTPAEGNVGAGARTSDGAHLVNARMALLAGDLPQAVLAGTNTTIGVIATDAVLTKAQAHRLAQVAHDGLARSINPVHTLSDGDTLFALGTGKSGITASMLRLSVMAAEVTALAVVRGVLAAQAVHIGGQVWPAAADMQPVNAA